MAVKVNELERKFKFNGKELPDPDPNMKPEEVMELYSRQYPSLTNGKIAGPFYEGSEEHWKLQGSYGTKG
jgi:PRTRC genetic system protein C